MSNTQNAAATSTTTTEQGLPEVKNLAETRKEMAEAKKRHPASVAKAARVAAAKKATAEAKADLKTETPAAKETPAGRKTPAQSGRAKLRWHALEGEDAKTGQVVGGMFAIMRSGNAWKLEQHEDGKTTVLLDGVTRSKAYAAATALHHRDEQPEAAKK